MTPIPINRYLPTTQDRVAACDVTTGTEGSGLE